MIDNFFNFKETGVLKLDRIFFESYYPILFTCINEKNDLFLCVCCQADSNIRKWLVTNVLPRTVIKLLNNEITIRDSFLKDKGLNYTIVYNMKKRAFQIEKDNEKDWDAEKSINLPTTGEYMDAEKDEFLEEIEHFKDMEIQYRNDMDSEVIKTPQNQIIHKEYFDYNSYQDSCYITKYITESIKELNNNNNYYSVLFDKNQEKLDLGMTLKSFEHYSNISFDDNKMIEVSLTTDLDTKKDFCINNNESNYISAA